jgi:hypothetical protein
MNAFPSDYIPQIEHKKKPPAKRPTTEYKENAYIGSLSKRTDAEKGKTGRITKPSGL